MCESAAYILKEDGMERIMDNVVSVDPFDGKVYLTDLLGEQKIVDGEIKEIRLMDHKIIIKENKYKIIGSDIQYQDGIFEILEKDKDIQFLIISEILYGKNNLNELIEKIQKINSKIKIILILYSKRTSKHKCIQYACI